MGLKKMLIEQIIENKTLKDELALYTTMCQEWEMKTYELEDRLKEAQAELQEERDEGADLRR